MMLVGVPEWINVIVTVLLVLGIRLVSLKCGWSLPVYVYDDERVAEIDPKYALTSYFYRRARMVPGARQVYRGIKRMRRTDPRPNNRADKEEKE